MEPNTNFLKAHWPELLLLIGGIIACYFLLRGCGNTNVLTTTVVSVGRAESNYKDSSRILQGKYDSVVALSYAKDFQIKQLRAHSDSVDRELLIPAEQLHEQAGDIAKTIATGNDLRVKRDTPRIVMNCDTMVRQYIAIEGVAKRYKQIADSAIAIHQEVDLQRDYADSLKDELVVNLIAQKNLDTRTLDTLSKGFKTLQLDDQKKTIQLKIYKPLAVVGGAGILFVAAKYILIPLLKK